MKLKLIQHLEAAPLDSCIWDLLPVETPFQNFWIRHCNEGCFGCYSETLDVHSHAIIETDLSGSKHYI